MDISNISNYVKSQYLILIPVLYYIGWLIQRTERINNKWIPSILTVISVVLVFLSSWSITFEGFIQGILIAAASVYTNQLFKQSIK